MLDYTIVATKKTVEDIKRLPTSYSAEIELKKAPKKKTNLRKNKKRLWCCAVNDAMPKSFL